jgi:predicted acetyltransferase
MGFGYGPKMHQYHISPESFPRGGSKSNLRWLSSEDQEKVIGCYSRVVLKSHGMFLKTESESAGMFLNQENRMIGFEKENEIRGYILFSFEKRSQSNFVHNDLVIKEFIYEDPEAFLELSTFLKSQADQVNRVVWNTQEDNAHYLLEDPRNGSNNLIPSVYHETNLSGIGLMYRIINVKGIIEDLENHNFNLMNTKLQLSIKDTFLPQNNVELILHSNEGWLKVVEEGEYDVGISLDISDFSSMIMGVVTFRELYLFGRAEITDTNYLDTLNHLFSTNEKPRCITIF